ncbi:hypothetical protein DC522_30825 [Microvirga sp. KLBC 81]|uniref:hypothetical protein n=1 Tax=Microvirga sp. KLBC 81 TaxID=1862707 RepID=UPI000D522C58|nr:hypothetical protein [Microvirga sp. KLBC 81]PVE20680.1 hypothetical protein DC522_30825 [Microvirga sp. KLBC 81]
MTGLPHRPFLRLLGHGFAVAALLVVMAVMALAAGLALLGALISLPACLGFMAVRQCLSGRAEWHPKELRT